MATILVVDDYSTTQRLLSFILRQSNHTVVTAVHGMRALEHLAGSAVDLVITDLTMPVMDGLTLLQELRADARFQALPVIILTGSPDEQDNALAKAAGATTFLTKPVESEELLATVHRLLAQREDAEAIQQQEIETPQSTGGLESQLVIGKPYLAKRT